MTFEAKSNPLLDGFYTGVVLINALMPAVLEVLDHAETLAVRAVRIRDIMRKGDRDHLSLLAYAMPEKMESEDVGSVVNTWQDCEVFKAENTANMIASVTKSALSSISVLVTAKDSLSDTLQALFVASRPKN